MAGADVCNRDDLLVSITWGAIQLGIGVGASFECSVVDEPGRGEGVTGPSCPAVVATDLVAVADFLIKDPVDPIANAIVAADLVIVCKRANQTSVSHTCKSMHPRGYRWAFDRDNPPARWSQTFRHKGSMATEASFRT